MLTTELNCIVLESKVVSYFILEILTIKRAAKHFKFDQSKVMQTFRQRPTVQEQPTPAHIVTTRNKQKNTTYCKKELTWINAFEFEFELIKNLIIIFN